MGRNKQTTAYHEAGHAAADWNFGFKIKQVTIVSRVKKLQ
jgi:ATP-dependent Zn protease